MMRTSPVMPLKNGIHSLFLMDTDLRRYDGFVNKSLNVIYSVANMLRYIKPFKFSVIASEARQSIKSSTPNWIASHSFAMTVFVSNAHLQRFVTR